MNVDALTYAGNLENLRDLESDARPRVRARATSATARAMLELMRRHAVDAVVNFAAESHVDRSIMSAEPFLDTNVGGTLRLLESARAAGIRRFVQVSTDEVYGTWRRPAPFEETTPLSRAARTLRARRPPMTFVMAFHHTHGMDMVITRCSNNYGPDSSPRS